ncbi:uncharacterized protein LOC123557692 [Mercenaria mercenaria]|uniref:uncharacterized protein LOC123557692 n=1 Tax=Mercenaria mercenaria TaxID=6596 RepID=UPI001E1D8722|nr:uncharacterized protein LOC123557692 [Mercenaria mercenaria]
MPLVWWSTFCLLVQEVTSTLEKKGGKKEKMDLRNIFSTVTVFLAWLLTVQGQMFELDPMDMMQLTSAVRHIVHPNAQPTPEMMAIATRQGGPPATIAQMLQYTPFFVNLATQMGVRPPGTNGTVTRQALTDFIVAKGNQWMQQQGALAGMTGGQMGFGSEMTGIGGLTGRMGSVGRAAPVQPLGSLMGQYSAGFGFSPVSMMLLNGEMDLHMPMMNSLGSTRNPLSMMYFMENMM